MIDFVDLRFAALASSSRDVGRGLSPREANLRVQDHPALVGDSSVVEVRSSASEGFASAAKSLDPASGWF